MYDQPVEKSIGFGQRVKEARYQAGLQQSDLADALGVSLSAVQSWEQGVRMPRARLLKRIAAVTGREISWFFEVAA